MAIFVVVDLGGADFCVVDFGGVDFCVVDFSFCELLFLVDFCVRGFLVAGPRAHEGPNIDKPLMTFSDLWEASGIQKRPNWTLPWEASGIPLRA